MIPRSGLCSRQRHAKSLLCHMAAVGTLQTHGHSSHGIKSHRKLQEKRLSEWGAKKVRVNSPCGLWLRLQALGDQEYETRDSTNLPRKSLQYLLIILYGCNPLSSPHLPISAHWGGIAVGSLLYIQQTAFTYLFDMQLGAPLCTLRCPIRSTVGSP